MSETYDDLEDVELLPAEQSKRERDDRVRQIIAEIRADLRGEKRPI